MGQTNSDHHADQRRDMEWTAMGREGRKTVQLRGRQSGGGDGRHGGEEEEGLNE